MSLTTVAPRTAERLLESLGAHPDLRDALLGDMAEEYALRAAWDGERAAGRWYRREAWRVAPHLLRDSARRLRWADARRLAGIVLTSHVFAVTAGTLFFALLGPRNTLRLFGTLGFEPNGMWIPWRNPFLSAAMLAVRLAATAAGPALGGYIAAWIDDQRPLVAAVALGGAWSCLPLAALALGPTGPGWPAWYRFGQVAAVVGGATLGGVLRVARARAAQ